MLCSFGISTEASAPAVLCLKYIHPCTYTLTGSKNTIWAPLSQAGKVIYYTNQPILQNMLHYSTMQEFIIKDGLL